MIRYLAYIPIMLFALGCLALLSTLFILPAPSDHIRRLEAQSDSTKVALCIWVGQRQKESWWDIRMNRIADKNLRKWKENPIYIEINPKISRRRKLDTVTYYETGR